MASAVHIPKPLLAAGDCRARTLRISRNRPIVRALERELETPDAWSPRFLEKLREVDDDDLLEGLRHANA